MTTTQTIATNIRTIARARNMKLKDLSDQLGFKHEQQLYMRLRNGRFTALELAEAAEILGCDPGDLYAENPFLTAGGIADLRKPSSACATADSESYGLDDFSSEPLAA
jgi:DNA-binding Xre family transcriptional regulator